MTNSNRIANLDEVLAEYAHASQEFNAKVLQAFVDKYPDHARALRRYAQVQLASVAASAEEVENEQLSDQEMLPLQSKLLQRMQQLRGRPTTTETEEALARLAAISGNKATQAATVAVFGTWQHGEDLLLLCVTEPPPGVEDAPAWVFARLGAHIGLPPPVVHAGIAMKTSTARHQHFSARSKPIEAPPMKWAEAIQRCITDEAAKTKILKMTK